MIGNTDYSSAYRHNEKLLFVDGNIMPIPYDFDMSGLVDASYAVVSVGSGSRTKYNRRHSKIISGVQTRPSNISICKTRISG